MLKAPRTERLKVKYDETLSVVGFKFNLRRFSWVANMAPRTLVGQTLHALDGVVGRCRLTVSTPVLKVHLVSAIND